MAVPGTNVDVAIIGGGAVGAAIGCGLAAAGVRVVILDEGDTALRATRGNFGHVWVQTKGAGFPHYARLSRRSSDMWAAFADKLKSQTGIDCAYERKGGVHICPTESETDFFSKISRQLQQELGPENYEFETLDNRQLSDLFPGIASHVPAGLFTKYDGICNPLLLHRALLTAFEQHGGTFLPDHGVRAIQYRGGAFDIQTSGDRSHIGAQRLVLAAGLGNAHLAPMVGLRAPVVPLQGQLIVTERTAPFMQLPNNLFRVMAEGTLMLGHSEAEVGLDTDLILPAAGSMAARCVEVFPWLADLQVVRIWAALRIMSPDNYPIYDQSTSCPGAFLMTCHSGITLAAFHAEVASAWIATGAIPDEFGVFSVRRFHVQ